MRKSVGGNNMKLFIITIALAVLITSCNSSLSGRYTVTAIKSQSGDDLSIRYLKSIFLEKSFDMTFDDSYVTITSLETHYQFKLHRWRDHNVFTYLSTNVHMDNVDYTIALNRDTGFTMDVTAAFVNDTTHVTIVPGPFGGRFGRCARMWFVLERAKE